MRIIETGWPIEALESRFVLSASIDPNGILTIIGTGKNDNLVLTQDSANVYVSENGGVAQPFASSLITSISIDMFSGNDRVSMQQKGGKLPVKIKALIVGGKGNDTLNGGRGQDTLSGSADNDLLDGGFNVDTIIGGPDFDTVSYSGRATPVTFSFDGVQNDGEFKEFDSVQTEAVIGGSSDDLFIVAPTDPGNEFFGGPGIDAIDYTFLNVAPNQYNEVSLDDVANDGVNGTSNVHSDIENVYGSKFADRIFGTDGDNSLLGNDDNDEIHGGLGNDFVSGGGGEDTMTGDEDDDFLVNINVSTDENFDGDNVSGGPGFDFVQGDIFDVIGSTETTFDTIDRVNGAPPPAPPQASADAAPITLNGTSGADSIVINQNATVISWVINGVPTTVPADTVSAITVECAGGADFVVMSKGDGTNTVLVPTSVSGGNGNDTLKGGNNRDTIGGGGGNDLLVGNAGNDRLVGGLGSDNFQAGSGNDVMIGDTSTADTTGFGGDNFEGGPGSDLVDHSTRTDALRITMDDDIANDGGTDGAEGDNVHQDVENLVSGSGNDRIVGNALANLLSGGPGNDSLRGGGGLDKLVGGTGLDTVLGNAGIDLMLMSDGERDDFDSALDALGIPIGDFANGDSTLDVSTITARALGTAAA